MCVTPLDDTSPSQQQEKQLQSYTDSINSLTLSTDTATLSDVIRKAEFSMLTPLRIASRGKNQSMFHALFKN